jgi:hypothetical protein
MENQSPSNLIDIVPTILWVALAGVVFFMLRRTIEKNVLPRLTEARGQDLSSRLRLRPTS